MNSHASNHIPVLYEELIWALRFFDTNVIVDATLGLWWHAIWVIEKLDQDDIFIGIDCDLGNLLVAENRILDFSLERSHIPTIYLIHENFRNLDQIISSLHTQKPLLTWNTLFSKNSELTGMYADLWVNSVHFDTPERWFSFRSDGPLDMRLDTSDTTITAKNIINESSYEELARIFRIYGDEPKAGWIAKNIIEKRRKWTISTTKELTDIIQPLSRDALPRVFQALRIETNQEYTALESLLKASIQYTRPWWRLVLISFHSWEDRIVKNIFRDYSHGPIDPITGQEILSGKITIINKKPITPTQEEIMSNPRSRSALLRIGEIR